MVVVAPLIRCRLNGQSTLDDGSHDVDKSAFEIFSYYRYNRECLGYQV